MESAKGRGGRPPKGDRRQLTIRAPKSDFAVYAAAADRAGLGLGDYVAFAMARAHGLPAPDYLDLQGAEPDVAELRSA